MKAKVVRSNRMLLRLDLEVAAEAADFLAVARGGGAAAADSPVAADDGAAATELVGAPLALRHRGC